MTRLRASLNPGREDGQVLVFVALMMVALLLAAALAIDPPNGFVNKQALQNTADASALGAAGDLASSGCYTDTCIGSYVNKWSGLNKGPTNLQNCSSSPTPLNCYGWPYQGNINKIEVKLTGSSQNFFGTLYGAATTGLKARRASRFLCKRCSECSSYSWTCQRVTVNVQ